MPKPYLSEIDKMLMGPLPPEKLDRIENEIQQGTVLAEVFGHAFFARVRGQLRAAEKQEAIAYSNIFSILEIDDQRKNLSQIYSPESSLQL
ncbi:hypothetical protein KKF55_03180 [Patescibacteria group bacterium]|nr:hypothetical protein [Patescibacteria group bacterium]